MKKHKLNILILLLLIPVCAIGQIPEGHFLDADEAAEKGYKIKPFIQKKEGIYHYAVLTQLPFVNNCTNELSEKERIACSEKNLRDLISSKLNTETEYKGNVYVYLTITENAEIVDISVKSYPPSKEMDKMIKEATRKINFHPGEYKEQVVKSRLWTSIKFE